MTSPKFNIEEWKKGVAERVGSHGLHGDDTAKRKDMKGNMIGPIAIKLHYGQITLDNATAMLDSINLAMKPLHPGISQFTIEDVKSFNFPD